MKKPVIALMYDFDRTLCAKDMQEYSFIPSVGMEASEFWKESNQIAVKNNMDKILAYMFLMIRAAKEKGVSIVEVLLHVGLGTFRPVNEDNILSHKMHSEYIEVTKENADFLNKAKQEGRRIIAVGTTSVRVLESATDDNGIIHPCEKETDIFIYPGYKFKMVDGLVTNFHLPESTLIMLVSAFLGYDETMEMYRVAVENKYRFFSFGDATLLI